MTTWIAALCTASICGGLVLVAVALRGVEAPGPRARRTAPFRVQREAQRYALAGMVGATLWLWTRWPVVAIAAAAGVVVLPWLLEQRHMRSAQVAVREAVASFAETLRDTLRAGAGLETAILACADAAPLAIERHVTLLAAELKGRSRLKDALLRFADRVGDPTCDRVVAGLCLNSKEHALSDTLTALARSARQDVEQRRRQESVRDQVRTTAGLIVVVSVVAIGWLLLFDRQYLEPYGTVRGQIVLGAIMGFFALSFWWLAQLTRDAPPVRFLGHPGEHD